MCDAKPKIDPQTLSPYVTSASLRNRDPILGVLKTLLPEEGDVLEIASGSGAHVNYFAPHFPGVTFQPSDSDASVFETMMLNRARAGNANVADPVRIDLTEPARWPLGQDHKYDVIFAINVFHLAPVSAADGFAEIAARALKPGGFAAIYGPFKVEGQFTTPSNEAFDKSLRAAGGPGWGLKDVSDLEIAAQRRGVALQQRISLPANNFMLVFQKR